MHLFYSQSASEKKLELIKNLVDIYLPQMEKRVGLSLGKVEVLNRKELAKEVQTQFRYGLESHYENQFTKAAQYACFKIISASLLIYTNNNQTMSYQDSKIYVPFGLTHTLEDFLPKKLTNPLPLEHAVVHELTHHVWNVICNKKHYRDPKWVFFAEGYATYGHSVWFVDLLPSAVSKLTDENMNSRGRRWQMYVAAKNKISELVKQHGEEILLRLPTEWGKFEIK